MAVSFTGGGNRSTLKKPKTCRKSLSTLSHIVVSSTPRYERSNIGREFDRGLDFQRLVKFKTMLKEIFDSVNSHLSTISRTRRARVTQ